MNTHKTCRGCGGVGGQDVDHWTRNPELESFDTCGECGGRGRIRFAPVDALDKLAQARRVRLSARAGSLFFADWPKRAADKYAAVRSDAMRQVGLP